ncbi:Pc16g12670 [Penicillium rubens Wisconsin 54-1255]|uniref:Pc16g12670 protein n=1 Tax=Penicillium rubens (strain ATCC 28089 / DSM 1075 / NRRL 1951 / Wisconsin 54-1255) TaxID=500485 RepID=B6HAF8_PENRW|nr:Pc16g12670 [Penicillium rubens Wisconsin 54-1255]
MASMAVSLVARGIYHETSPAMQTRAQINPTLMMSWWVTIFSLLIIIVRLCGRYIRVERFFAEDKVMMISVIPLVIRMVLVHFVLILGTNNTTTTGLTEQEISNRELGTVVIATLAECQPFHHYWQVIPDPGPTCRTGYVNLITMGTCDVITDLLLVAIPIPIILMAQMPLKRRLTLSTLFCLSLILVGITSYRVPSVIEHQGSQPYRSLLASLEILAATAVSNVLVIGSFVRDRGIKKLKYKRAQGSASVSESMDKSFIRRNTVMQHQWGSDSELATGLCIRLDPDMYTIPDPDETRLPRPAPTAPPAHIPLAVARTGTLDPTWSFATTRHSDDDRISATESLERKVSPHEYLRTSQSPREISPSSQTRRVSLSDVGGLLTRALPESASDHVRAQTCLSSPVEGVQRRLGAGSRAFLEDVGIFGPRAAANRPRPPDSGPAELPFPPAAFGNRLISMSGSSDATLHADVELHDVGGLLARRDH